MTEGTTTTGPTLEARETFGTVEARHDSCEHGVSVKSCGVCYSAAETVGAPTHGQARAAGALYSSSHTALMSMDDHEDCATCALDRGVAAIADWVNSVGDLMTPPEETHLVERLYALIDIAMTVGVAESLEQEQADDDNSYMVIDDSPEAWSAAFNVMATPSSDVQAARLLARQARITADQAQLDADQVAFNETQEPLDRHDQHIGDILEQPHGAGCEQ